MSYEHPYPDPELARIVEDAGADLAHFPDKLRLWRDSLATGRTADDVFGPPRGDAEELCEAAVRMCDEGQFRHALSIALHLATRDSTDARFTFLAGSCLQRLDMPQLAVAMFSLSAAAGGPLVALFRAAECLRAVGQADQAVQVFETVVELARDDASYAQLQDVAAENASALRNSARA